MFQALNGEDILILASFNQKQYMGCSEKMKQILTVLFDNMVYTIFFVSTSGIFVIFFEVNSALYFLFPKFIK